MFERWGGTNRHRGGTLQQRQASCRKQKEKEALRLLDATRKGAAALARCAGEAEGRWVESEARRLRVGTEVCWCCRFGLVWFGRASTAGGGH